MNFIFPQFLWALGVLVIPIVIHLFNFRRYRRIMFSNVRMLKDIETQSRKTKQLKKWLVLLTRLLAIASLVLAFAQPFLPHHGGKLKSQLISIYIDNSQSMLAEGENGQLFEVAKNQAREIIRNVPQNSKIQILDNSLNYNSNKILSPANAIRLIDDLEVDYRPNKLGHVIQKIQNIYQSQLWGTNHAFLLSDFQKQEDLSVLDLDSNYNIYIYPSKSQANHNISVDSVWLASPITHPHEPMELIVRIKNHEKSDEVSSTLTLHCDGNQQLVKSIRLPANSSEDFLLTINPSFSEWISGEIILDDVPITFDNSYFFTIPTNPKIRVIQLGKYVPELARIFEQDSTFQYAHYEVDQLDYSLINTCDFIVLNQIYNLSSGLIKQLLEFVNSGGVLSLFPDRTNDVYAPLLDQMGLSRYGKLSIQKANISPSCLKLDFYKDAYKRIPPNIFLPSINAFYSLKLDMKSEAILFLKEGSPIITQTPFGSGTVFQSAIPLDSNQNYISSELFVITHLKMAFGNGRTHSLSYEVNTTNPIYLPINYSGVIQLEKSDMKVLTDASLDNSGVRFWLNDELSEAGVYTVRQTNNEMLSKVALNYSRDESHFTFFSDKDLEVLFSKARVSLAINDRFSILKSIQDMQEGTHLWKLFVLLCLIFLLIEILLLRFIKS